MEPAEYSSHQQFATGWMRDYPESGHLHCKYIQQIRFTAYLLYYLVREEHYCYFQEFHDACIHLPKYVPYEKAC